MKKLSISVFPRKGTRWWWYSVSIDGERYQGTCRKMGLSIDTHNREQAIDAVMEHFTRNPKIHTLEQIRSSIGHTLSLQNVRESTIEKYEQALGSLIELLGKDCFAGDVKRADIERFKSHLLKQGIKPPTVNSKLRMLRAIFQRLTDNELIEYNPFVRFRPVREVRNELSVFSKSELAILFNTMRQSNSKDNVRLCLILAFTGRRGSEILLLHRDDVDLKNGRFRPMNIKHRDRRKRWLFIPPRAIKYFQWFMEKYPRSPYPFKVVRIDGLSRWFRKWREKAGLPPEKHLHSLRNSFITHALKSASPWEIKQYLDHSTVQLTESYYRELSDTTAAIKI